MISRRESMWIITLVNNKNQRVLRWGRGEFFFKVYLYESQAQYWDTSRSRTSADHHDHTGLFLLITEKINFELFSPFVKYITVKCYIHFLISRFRFTNLNSTCYLFICSFENVYQLFGYNKMIYSIFYKIYYKIKHIQNILKFLNLIYLQVK